MIYAHIRSGLSECAACATEELESIALMEQCTKLLQENAILKVKNIELKKALEECISYVDTYEHQRNLAIDLLGCMVKQNDEEECEDDSQEDSEGDSCDGCNCCGSLHKS